MRASRLVSILLLLQTRGRLTAQQLADVLEVSVRTIYRDVDALAEAGVPLYGEPGKDGGYRVLDGYRTRLTGLTEQEAMTLFLAGLPEAAADLGLGAAVTATQLKLTAALPAELRDHADRMRERFHLDAPSWYHDAEEVPQLTAIAEAVWAQRSIRLRYQRWALPHEVTRTVQPYGLVLKAGHWYLVARDSDRLRTYRVSRILELDQLDDHFDRDPGFDLAEHWQHHLAGFDARRHSAQARIRLSPKGFVRLPDLMEPLVVEVLSRVEPDVDGWRTASIPIESVDHAVPELLKLGAEVEVLAPVELRDHIIATVNALTGVYNKGQPRSAPSGCGPGGEAKARVGCLGG